MISRRTFTGLAAGALMLGLAGPALAQDALPADLEAAGGMDELIAKAKAEGSVLVYGAPVVDQFTAWVKGFEELYGIPVQYYRAPTNAVYQRLAQEQRAGKNMADILAISDLRVLLPGIEDGYIAPYTPENATKFPADKVVDTFAYPLFLNMTGVGWNTRVVPEDLQEALFADPYNALLDPRLKGKITIVDVTAGGAQLAVNANLVLNLADEFGWEYMKKLAAQDVAVMRTSPLVLDGVISGDYWVAAEAYDTTFGGAALAGAEVAFRLPPTAAGSVFYTSVVNNAPHPFAARLFTEWATSVEAQSELSGIMEASVLVEGWEDRRDVSKLPWYKPAEEAYTDWQTDPRVQGENLEEFYAEWKRIFGQN